MTAPAPDAGTPPAPSATGPVAVPPPPRRRPEPLAGVLVLVAVGLALAWLHHPRMGLYLVSGALGLAAAARLLLPPRVAGLLVVRGRVVDVVTLLVLAGALFAVATVTTFPRPGA